jgi:hypothetical protein
LQKQVFKASASKGDKSARVFSNGDKVRKAVLRNRVMKVEKLATTIHAQHYHQHERSARIGHRDELCKTSPEDEVAD